MRIVEFLASRPAVPQPGGADMKIRGLGVSMALLAMASVPAFAANADVSSLNDFRVHGFSGCLAQEPTGVHYFDLKNAKSDDGKELGTVRLTSSIWGIRPKQ